MPGWGEQRISGMIAGRPDWCVSRQRTWGVPIPLFVDKDTGELHPRTLELIEDVAHRHDLLIDMHALLEAHQPFMERLTAELNSGKLSVTRISELRPSDEES